jgi:hypothetical protein
MQKKKKEKRKKKKKKIKIFSSQFVPLNDAHDAISQSIQANFGPETSFPRFMRNK